MTLNTRKLERLEQQLQDLEEEHKAIFEKYRCELDPVNRINLGKELCYKEEEILTKELEVRNLKEQEIFPEISEPKADSIPENESGSLAGKNQDLTTSSALVYDLKFSEILSDLNKKFRDAPENITDSRWISWFQEMFELQHIALQSISYKIGQLLNAHRTTVYFITSTSNGTNVQQELWSIVAQGSASLEIRVPFGEGVSGKTAQKKETILVPFDAYINATDTTSIKAQDKRTGYRTYTLLTLPLLNEQGDLIAVFQFLNKMLSNTESSKVISSEASIQESEIDHDGFSQKDQLTFNKYIPEIRLVLESYQNYYQQFNKLQSIVNFSSATLSLNQSEQSLSDILKGVIEKACKITNADRGTFWLLDRKRSVLRAKVKEIERSENLTSKSLEDFQEELWKDLETQVGEGFAGRVAELETHFNIPFDLYDHPDSSKAKEADRITGYRTYSLLCMPVFSSNTGELIGVTQLLNKRHNHSNYPNYIYDHSSHPEIPNYFRASFTHEDEERLRNFNIQVANAIENARQPLMSEQYDKLAKLFQAISQLAGGFINAHRTFIYLVDKEASELWSIIPNKEENKSFEASIPIVNTGSYKDYFNLLEKGIYLNSMNMGTNQLLETLANTGKIDFYPVYNKICVPIRSRKNPSSFIAIVEFMNKLKQEHASKQGDIRDIIDPDGFKHEDAEDFEEDHSKSIADLIEAFLESYNPVKQHFNRELLRYAKESVTHDKTSSMLPLQQVVIAARKLVNAHRGTLWIVDSNDHNTLYANFLDSDDNPKLNNDGSLQYTYLTIGEGYAGQAAQEAINITNDQNINSQDISSHILTNIQFDPYSYESESRMARRTDQRSHYRTCSLLCMPIFSPDKKLLGIIQLLNKIRRGYEGIAKDYKNLDPNLPPPECFMASFSPTDERLMTDFNAAVGYILQLIEVLDGSKLIMLQEKLKRLQSQAGLNSEVE